MVSGGVTIMDKNLPSPEYLRERLRYCHETGKLFWRDHPDLKKNWRTRFLEKEAFAYINVYGYKIGELNKRKFRAHRVIWAIVHGQWPDGEIDHIDHCKTNNRIENLRVVDKADNMRNRPMRRKSKYGVFGVFFCDRMKKWWAIIGVESKNKYLGSYEKFEDAVAARKAAEREYGYHENHGM